MRPKPQPQHKPQSPKPETARRIQAVAEAEVVQVAGEAATEVGLGEMSYLVWRIKSYL